MKEFRAGQQGVETGNAPGSIQAALVGEETADMLFELLPNVVHRQHPEVAAVLRGKSEPLDRALDQFYPGEHPALTPFFQFGSWIGGDRDGNPFVTNDVTRRALKQNALASLRHYEQHLSSLLQSMSIAERAMPLSAAFKEALANALAHPECTRIA